jgi:hypothetical protein
LPITIAPEPILDTLAAMGGVPLPVRAFCSLRPSRTCVLGFFLENEHRDDEALKEIEDETLLSLGNPVYRQCVLWQVEARHGHRLT